MPHSGLSGCGLPPRPPAPAIAAQSVRAVPDQIDGLAPYLSSRCFALFEAKALGEARPAVAVELRQKRSRQDALWSGQRIQDCKVVGAVHRQQMPRKTVLGPSPGIFDRLAA